MDPAPPRDGEPYVPLEELYDDDHLALIERARVVAREAEAVLAGELPSGPPARSLDGTAADRGGVVIELFADDHEADEWAWDDRSEAAGDGVTFDDGRNTAVGLRLRRFGASGAMLAGMMVGIGDVLEPDKIKTHEIEYAPDPADEDSQLVTFHLVAGSPEASRLVVRPWLLERVLERRRRRAEGVSDT